MKDIRNLILSSHIKIYNPYKYIANNTRKGFFSSNVSLNNNVIIGNLIIPEEYDIY